MALDMRTAIGGMIEKWRALGHDLGFGIGIAHGFATLGTIGFEGRFDTRRLEQYRMSLPGFATAYNVLRF